MYRPYPNIQNSCERKGMAMLIMDPNVGGGMQVLISEFNKLDDGRYFDGASKSSWSFDHMTQVCQIGIRSLQCSGNAD